MTDAPTLTDTIEITAEQRADFAARGHAVVRGLASAEEVEFFRPAIEAGVRRFTANQAALEDRDTYGKAFLQVPNLCFFDETVPHLSQMNQKNR